MITLIMWGFLPLFWGSLWRSTSYSHNLSIAVVDRDGGSLGRAIVGAAEANANGTSTGGSLVGRLGFINVPESELPSDGSVIEAVVENKYWAALVGELVTITYGSNADPLLFAAFRSRLPSQRRRHIVAGARSVDRQRVIRPDDGHQLLLQSRPERTCGQQLYCSNHDRLVGGDVAEMGGRTGGSIVRPRVPPLSPFAGI